MKSDEKERQVERTKVKKSYLIVTMQLPVVFCRLVSISMWAPVVSRIALILHPPRPITRLMTEDETDIFLDLQRKTNNHNKGHLYK